MPSRTHFLVKKLLDDFRPKKEPISLLDFGCGSGDLINVLNLKKIKKYHGVDPNQAGIKHLKKEFTSPKITAATLNPQKKLNLGRKKYDVVVAVGVLQYLSNSEIKQFFGEAYRTLNPGGILVLTCTRDFWLYKVFNIYRLFLPHRYLKEKETLSWLREKKFSIKFLTSKGLILNPLFSNFFVFFADAIDRLISKSRGSLGPVGKWLRKTARPVLDWEFNLKTNFGHTMVIVAKK